MFIPATVPSFAVQELEVGSVLSELTPERD